MEKAAHYVWHKLIFTRTIAVISQQEADAAVLDPHPISPQVIAPRTHRLVLEQIEVVLQRKTSGHVQEGCQVGEAPLPLGIVELLLAVYHDQVARQDQAIAFIQVATLPANDIDIACPEDTLLGLVLWRRRRHPSQYCKCKDYGERRASTPAKCPPCRPQTPQGRHHPIPPAPGPWARSLVRATSSLPPPDSCCPDRAGSLQQNATVKPSMRANASPISYPWIKVPQLIDMISDRDGSMRLPTSRGDHDPEAFILRIFCTHACDASSLQGRECGHDRPLAEATAAAYAHRDRRMLASEFSIRDS